MGFSTNPRIAEVALAAFPLHPILGSSIYCGSIIASTNENGLTSACLAEHIVHFSDSWRHASDQLSRHFNAEESGKGLYFTSLVVFGKTHNDNEFILSITIICCAVPSIWKLQKCAADRDWMKVLHWLSAM